VSPFSWRTHPGVSFLRNISSESLTLSIRSMRMKNRSPFGKTMSCVHCDPGFLPGAAYSYLYVVLTATKSLPRTTSGFTGFIRWQSCGPSTTRLRWLEPGAMRAYVGAAGSVSFSYHRYRLSPLPSAEKTLSSHSASLPASMSQSTTMSPSPISRKPVALSRKDPFSIPVIHCLGFFLGMTASSLSVSILIARSSSFTCTHSVPGAAATRPGVAMTTSEMANSRRGKYIAGPLRAGGGSECATKRSGWHNGRRVAGGREPQSGGHCHAGHVHSGLVEPDSVHAERIELHRRARRGRHQTPPVLEVERTVVLCPNYKLRVQRLRSRAVGHRGHHPGGTDDHRDLVHRAQRPRPIPPR